MEKNEHGSPVSRWPVSGRTRPKAATRYLSKIFSEMKKAVMRFRQKQSLVVITQVQEMATNGTNFYPANCSHGLLFETTASN